MEFLTKMVCDPLFLSCPSPSPPPSRPRVPQALSTRASLRALLLEELHRQAQPHFTEIALFICLFPAKKKTNIESPPFTCAQHIKRMLEHPKSRCEYNKTTCLQHTYVCMYVITKLSMTSCYTNIARAHIHMCKTKGAEITDRNK